MSAFVSCSLGEREGGCQPPPTVFTSLRSGEVSSHWGNEASFSPDATSKGAGGQAEQVALRCSLVRVTDSNGAGSASGI